MPDVHHVVCHTLLGYNDFLTTIDDEVSTLIISAIFTIFHSLMLIQVFKLTEVTTEHDWNLTDVNSSIVLLKDYFLDPALALTSLWAVIEVVLELFLAELDIGIKLRGICQVSHAGLVREDRHHAIIRLHDSRAAVHVYLGELYLVHDVPVGVPLLLACRVLWDFFNLNLSIL